MHDEDVIVVGSGPCGAAAASRLVERGIGVTMLDAGLRAPSGVIVRAAGNTLYRRMGWKYYSTDRVGPGTPPDVDWVSSLSLGGLSNFWTAAVPRFAPEDFTEGGRLDERYVWPISYEDLVPFYEAAEGMLQVTTGEAIPGVPSNLRAFEYRLPDDWRGLVERAASGGHALGALPMAKGHPWMIALRGTEFSSYHCVVRPLLSSSRFRLVPGAQVARIRTSGAAGHAEVDYVDLGSGTSKSIRGRAVVIAAGAIDSTAIVLRSTSPDFPHGIGNSAGLVGRYLHDHPREWYRATSERPLRALSHPMYIARSPHGTSDPLFATSLTLGLSSKSERLRTFYRGRTSTFGVQVFGTMVPTPDLGVTLVSPATDDPVRCRPTISLRYDQRTVDNLVAARDRLRDVFAAAGVQIDVPGPFHELRPGSSVHFGGTLRMHANPEFGVVDAWNRMHDVPNVVVCDSSCFTTGAEKNPTLTAMAIALRAADRLASDLGK